VVDTDSNYIDIFFNLKMRFRAG